MPSDRKDSAPEASGHGIAGPVGATAETAELQRQLLEAVEQAVMATDRDGAIIYWNRYAERLYGWSVDEVLGRSVLDVTPPPENRELAEEIMARLAAGQTWSGEFEVRRRDGSTFLAAVTDSPIVDGAGRVIGVVGISRDVTAERDARDELRESRERLERLMRTLADGVTFVDTSGRITYANAAAERILGLTRPDIHQRAYDDPEWRITAVDGGPFPPENLPFTRVVRTRRPVYGVEHAIEQPDGRRVVLSINAAPLFDAAGELMGLVSSLRDVTAQKNAEAERAKLLEQQRTARADAERRAEEERALREAVSAVTAAVTGGEAVRQIARGAYQATNAHFVVVERVDLAADSIRVVAVAGRDDLPLGSSLPLGGSLLETAIRTGRPVMLPNLNDPAAPPHLRSVCPRCTAVIVPMVDGETVVGGLVLLREPGRPGFDAEEVERARSFADLALIAFRKVEMLETSEAQRLELERIMESRARLVRGFTHDVKNPLGAADGYAHLLEAGVHGPLTAEQQDTVRRLRATLHSALELIDQSLELTRAETGQIPIDEVDVDPAALARDIAAEYRAQAEAARLTLELRIADDLPVIRSDPVRIRQILGNLIANAIKFTPRGGCVTLLLEPSRDGGDGQAEDGIAISVRDTGPGIPDELRESIFGEFVRGPETDRPGAGLGLAISASLARLLGAQLMLRTETGEGSTFTLWLPVRGNPNREANYASGPNR